VVREGRERENSGRAKEEKKDLENEKDER